MALALSASLVLLGVDRLGWLPLGHTAGALLAGIDFNGALMHGMLGALLFAGALHVDVEAVCVRSASRSRAWPPVRTILSTGIVGALVYGVATATVGRAVVRPLSALRRADLAHRPHCRAQYSQG